jgi:hypothetical protein
MFAVRLVLCLPVVLAAGKSDGTCGYQCTEDSQCGGCGTVGACSCPDGPSAQFPNISCSCVSAPANPPKDPAVAAADAAWPKQWTANVDAWCYGDFTSKNATANGKFYYDATLGKTRGDWKPYISGKDATQIWIVDGTSSKYYVKSGPLCIYFPITDPGQDGKPTIGVERPNWMQTCKDAGMATYIGREQVEGEWADHWACHLDYEAAGQQITFQNWHSLGLGKVPKGLPVRVTGGNSAPDSQKGSPRLNTVWYKDFVTGANATKPEDFTKPGGFCIPVGAAKVKAFFGHEVKQAHAWSPAFHKRAHYLLHAEASKKDLMRARRPKPGRAFRGSTFAETMQKLNDILLRDQGLRTQKCDSFPLELLQEMQRELFNARTHELNAVYHGAGDTRRMAHDSIESLESEQAKLALIKTPSLSAKARDGACHEMVMWYIHHLSESAREEIKERLVLPLLPEMQHEAAVAPDKEAAEVHHRYTAQASCAVCHTMATNTVVV